MVLSTTAETRMLTSSPSRLLASVASIAGRGVVSFPCFAGISGFADIACFASFDNVNSAVVMDFCDRGDFRILLQPWFLIAVVDTVGLHSLGTPLRRLLPSLRKLPKGLSIASNPEFPA
jgi:hypothetical protein